MAKGLVTRKQVALIQCSRAEADHSRKESHFRPFKNQYMKCEYCGQALEFITNLHVQAHGFIDKNDYKRWVKDGH